MGNLVLTGATSGSATVQATDAQTVTITLPATSGTLALTSGGGSPSFTSVTTTSDSTFNTVTVGKGGGNDATSVVVGSSTLSSSNTGTDNNAFGVGSLLANTTGSYGSAFGRAALRFNTTGNYNTAFGANALIYNTTASNNTAVGYQAGYSNTTGTENVFVGKGAGSGNTTASYCTIVGSSAGVNNAAGANTFVGSYAGNANTSGTYNTFIGSGAFGAGYYVTTGSKNTILGGFNGNQNSLDIRTSSNYIVLSDGDGNPRTYWDNNGGMWVGQWSATGATRGLRYDPNGSNMLLSSTTTSSDPLVRFYNPNGNVGAINTSGSATAYVTSSDYRLKENIAPMTGALATVAQLKPVTYKWKTDGADGQGFIAHELQSVVPECVIGEKDAVDAEGKPVYQGIDTSFLVATLTAAIQELNTKVTALEAQLGAK